MTQNTCLLVLHHILSESIRLYFLKDSYFRMTFDKSWKKLNLDFWVHCPLLILVPQDFGQFSNLL